MEVPAGVVSRGSFFIEAKCVGYTGADYPTRTPYPSDWDFIDLFPVPIGWFEDQHWPDFWNFVRNYNGGKKLHMGPLTKGVRQDENSLDWDDGEIITRYAEVPADLVQLPLSMNPSERNAAVFENRRRSRGHRILKNIVSQLSSPSRHSASGHRFSRSKVSIT